MFRPSLDSAYGKRQNEDDRLIVPDPFLSYLVSNSLERGQLTTRLSVKWFFECI